MRTATRSALAPLAALLAALAGCGDEASTRPAAVAPVASPPPAHPRGPIEDCSTQSWADFTGVFSDPANLVERPLVLVGAGAPTPAAVVETHGGNKFGLLVEDGHVVTVQVPPPAGAHAALGYGPLPQGEIDFRDGHDTVTFVACEGDSRSTAVRPVTFWSGFLLARRPSCVPLDVYVDDEPAPRRIEVELGRRC